MMFQGGCFRKGTVSAFVGISVRYQLPGLALVRFSVVFVNYVWHNSTTVPTAGGLCLEETVSEI